MSSREAALQCSRGEASYAELEARQGGSPAARSASTRTQSSIQHVQLLSQLPGAGALGGWGSSAGRRNQHCVDGPYGGGDLQRWGTARSQGAAMAS
jgi:hypothetical protein